MKLCNKKVLALLGSTLILSPVHAAIKTNSQLVQTKPNTHLATGSGAEMKKQEVLLDKQGQIIKEAADAVHATESVVKALNNNDSQQAKAALEVASGNLHLLNARYPNLELIPIDVQGRVFHLNIDMDNLKKLQAQVDDLIDGHSYQAARPLIDSMADELRVHIVYLPMATFPASLATVGPMIDAGRLSQAKEALYTTLDKLVFEEEVIPLAILRAEALIADASDLEHSGDLTKQDTKNKVETLLEAAGEQLKISLALGYGVKSDYTDLNDSIDSLRKEIGTGGFQGEWNKFKNVVAEFKHKFVHPAG